MDQAVSAATAATQAAEAARLAEGQAADDKEVDDEDEEKLDDEDALDEEEEAALAAELAAAEAAFAQRTAAAKDSAVKAKHARHVAAEQVAAEQLAAVAAAAVEAAVPAAELSQPGTPPPAPTISSPMGGAGFSPTMAAAAVAVAAAAATAAPVAAEPVAVDEKDKQLLKECKFIARSEGVIKEMLFVPPGMVVTPKKVEAIVKDQWKIPPPNMIVNLDAGTCHPMKLATKLLRDQPQFLGWIKQARGQKLKRRESFRVQRGGGGGGGDGSDDGVSDDDGTAAFEEEDPRDPASSLVNELIFQKMLEAFSAIVESACMSNNWILFDRTRLDGASGTAELLLELAMDRTKLRPVVVVIDSIERLKDWHHEAAAAQIEMIHKCREDALPITDEESHNAFTEHYDGSSYSTGDFGDWKKHPAYGAYTNKLSDLPTKAKEYHKEYSLDGTATISRERVWRYFYRMFLYNKGSHYVLLGDKRSRFPADSLAPVGSVCAHGGAGMYPRLRDLIHRGTPTVMLYNSGGVTHSFASVHNAIMNPPPEDATKTQHELKKRRHGKSKRNGAQLTAHDTSGEDQANAKSEAERILELVQGQIVSNEPWARSFGIPEIMKLTQVNTQEPRLFKKTVVVADLVHDSPEDMLAIVSGCFANMDMVSLELGHGNANLKVTFEAWRRHLSLYENSRHLHLYGDVLEIVVIIVSLITGALSVIFASLPKPCPTAVGVRPGSVIIDSCPLDIPAHGLTAKDIKQGMVILPIMSALLLTVQASLGWKNKASACDYGAVCIVSEIYKFRVKVLGYSSADHEQPADSDDDDDAAVASPLCESVAHRSRSVFVDRVTKAFDNTVSQGGTVALRYGGSTLLSCENKFGVVGANSPFGELLARHVYHNLYLRTTRQPEHRSHHQQTVLNVLDGLHMMIFMFALVILSVAVSINAEVEGTGDSDANYTFDIFVAAVFMIEMSFRMWALNSFHAFFSDPFCIMDFVIVVLDIIALSAKHALSHIGFTKALRAIRLTRIARLLRVARLINKAGGYCHGAKVELKPPPAPKTSSAHLFSMTEPDEHVGPVSIETYMGVRARAVKRVFERRAPQISFVLNFCEVLGFVVTSAGSILAVVGYTEWVVLTVLVTTIIKNAIAAAGWRPELAALNSGLLDIQNLYVWWNSLTIGDRSTRSTKEHCVTTVEGALMSVVAAKTVNVEEKDITVPDGGEGPPQKAEGK